MFGGTLFGGAIQTCFVNSFPLSPARAVASDPKVFENYFEQTFTGNDLLDKNSQILNMDESGMPLDPSLPKIVAKRGYKNPSGMSSDDKEQLTNYTPKTSILVKKTG